MNEKINITQENPFSEDEKVNKEKKKKVYESPEITVIEIETKDVINASTLIGFDATGENLLGYGQIEIDLK